MARQDNPYVAVVLDIGVKVATVSSFSQSASISDVGKTSSTTKQGEKALTAIFAYQALDGTNYVIYIPVS